MERNTAAQWRCGRFQRNENLSRASATETRSVTAGPVMPSRHKLEKEKHQPQGEITPLAPEGLELFSIAPPFNLNEYNPVLTCVIYWKVAGAFCCARIN